MTRVIGIDPGTTESAYVILDNGHPTAFGKIPNAELLDKVYRWPAETTNTTLAIEMIASYGMAVGAEVFETCVWIGRFGQAWRHYGGDDPLVVYRRDVKLHLCQSPRAKDGNVRQAIIDRFGGKELAIGRKATPGPLYGMSADVWQAMGVALVVVDGGVV